MLNNLFSGRSDIHNRLQEAREKYYLVTKYLPPEFNVAELPEKKELDAALFAHHNQCGCESNPCSFINWQTLAENK
jgi:hypothetical protein